MFLSMSMKMKNKKQIIHPKTTEKYKDKEEVPIMSQVERSRKVIEQYEEAEMKN